MVVSSLWIILSLSLLLSSKLLVSMIMLRILEIDNGSSGSSSEVKIGQSRWQLSNVHETGMAAVMEIKDCFVH